MTVQTLRQLLEDLKLDALKAGRYPSPLKASQWEKRDKKKAFRCMSYNRYVRQIGALEDAIAELQALKDSSPNQVRP